MFSLVNFNHYQSDRGNRSWKSVLVFYESPGLCVIGGWC